MVNQDFYLALELLEKEKGISSEEFRLALENALTIAYKKVSPYPSYITIKFGFEKKTIRIYANRDVVEEITEPERQILLEDAKLVKATAKVGDVLSEEVVSKSFGRIAAQTARQVLLQKLREIEHANTVSDFEDKEGELMSATVRRIEDGNVYVEIGGRELEGVLMARDQVPNEKYEVNQKINVFVKKVRNVGKTSQIVVSRSSTGLVKRLFENEVPEIKQGIVVIKSIARDAGQRTKIAISSIDPSVDAIGSCVGNKGARVNAIVAELNGEKIDIIPWSENPLEFISNSLSPARVIKVIHTGEQSALAIVPDDKLSLAIGRSGQNARLAVKLTGWKIDVKSESTAISELGEDAVKVSMPIEENAEVVEEPKE